MFELQLLPWGWWQCWTGFPSWGCKSWGRKRLTLLHERKGPENRKHEVSCPPPPVCHPLKHSMASMHSCTRVRGPPVALHVSQQISSESWGSSGVAAVSRYTPRKRPCHTCRPWTARSVARQAASEKVSRVAATLAGVALQCATKHLWGNSSLAAQTGFIAKKGFLVEHSGAVFLLLDLVDLLHKKKERSSNRRAPTRTFY